MKYVFAVFGLLALSIGIFTFTRMPFPDSSVREAVGERNVLEATLTPGSTATQSVVYYTNGLGPRVVLIPSAGREASDFNELSAALRKAGYRSLVVEHPGINGASESPPDFNLYAFPIFKVLENDGYLKDEAPYFLAGHAFGNRVTRITSTFLAGDQARQPSLSGVILLAAGGQVPMELEVQKAARNIFNPLRSYKSRMEDVRYAFFADGNEVPDHWRRGWHTKTAMAQGKTIAASKDDESWHCAGGVPMLIVQPMQDRLAPPENAYALKEKCPQVVEIVEVQNAGHALLPEQPDAVAEAVLAFLAKHHPVN